MSDPIQIENNLTDFHAVGGSIFASVPYREALIMFAVGFMLFSDTFVDKVLRQFPGAVHGECPTTKGTIGQLLAYSVILILVHMLIEYQVL